MKWANSRSEPFYELPLIVCVISWKKIETSAHVKLLQTSPGWDKSWFSSSSWKHKALATSCE